MIFDPVLFEPVKIQKYPEAVKIVNELYEKYYPKKQQFLDKIEGKPHPFGSAFLGNMSHEDSKTIITALNRIARYNISFRRRGRGPTKPAKNGKMRRHLTIDESSRFSIYANLDYRKTNQPSKYTWV